MKPPLKRWFKWRTRHAHGPSSWQYTYNTRTNVKQMADDESDGIRGYDVRAIKTPPARVSQREADPQPLNP